MRLLLPAFAALLLVACAGDGHEDLNEFVRTAHADKKPRIEPIPEIKPHEPFLYAASALPDPFSPSNLKPLVVGSARTGESSPDTRRRREPLEDYPLDALKMVGTLSRGPAVWAVVQAPDGTIHRLQAGNYVGQNYGRVRKVSDEKVNLIELIQTPNGDWAEREASLALAE